jgi:hypothetical protein
VPMPANPQDLEAAGKGFASAKAVICLPRHYLV